MANDFKIGAKLALDGEKEYKNAVADVGKSLAVLASEGKKTAAQYGENKNSLEALTKVSENYQKKADAEREKIDVIKDALENAKKVYGENSDKVKDWTIKLNNAEAQLAKTETAISKNKEAMKDAAKQESGLHKLKEAVDNLKEKAEKAVVPLEKMGKAALSVASAGAKLAGGAAKGAAVGVAAVSAAGAAAAKQLADAAKEAANAGDAIDEASQRMGVSAESYQKMAYAAKMSGVEIATLETAAKTLNKSREKESEALQKNTEKLQAQATKEQEAIYKTREGLKNARKEYGVGSKEVKSWEEKLEEAEKQLSKTNKELNQNAAAMQGVKKSSSEMTLESAIKQVASIKDESERTAKAIELFGSKAAYSMGPMLAQGADGVDALMNKAQEMGIVMSNDAVSASAKFNDALDNLTMTASAVKNTIVAELLPGTTEVMDGLTGLLSGEEGAPELVKKGAKDIIDVLGKMAPKFLEIIETVGGTVIEVAPDIVIALADGLISNLDEIVNAAFELLNALTNGLLTESNIKKVMDAALTLVTKLAGFAADNTDLVIDSAFIMIDGLIDGLLDGGNLDKLVNASLDIVTSIAGGLIDHIPDLFEAAKQLCKALFEAIKNYDWAAVAKDIFASIKDGIKNIFDGDDEDGSHAGGIGYVPYDGYTAQLHKGERVLTAAQNVTMSNNTSDKKYEALNRKIDLLMSQQNQGNVNVNISGSAAAVVRALNVSVERENRRKTAFA